VYAGNLVYALLINEGQCVEMGETYRMIIITATLL